MANDATAAAYLLDLGALIRDLALEAKRTLDAGRGAEGTEFRAL